MKNIAIVCENASRLMGGEAWLPLKYFEYYKECGYNPYLYTHSRCKNELHNYFGEADLKKIFFADDLLVQKIIHYIGQWLPEKVREGIFNHLIGFATELQQRKMISSAQNANKYLFVQKVTPVSPTVPSFVFGVGCPVFFGSMNGGIDYPPAFRNREQALDRFANWVKSRIGNIVHYLIPGKRLAAGFIVCNQRTEDSLPASLRKVPVGRSFDNGFEPTTWCDTQRRPDPEKPHIVYVGRLIELKGLDLAIDAISLIKSSLKVSIIGDGPARSSIERLASQSTTAEYQFWGHLDQPEIAKQLETATCLILPSLREAGGAAVLEAMAAGVPVVATKWGGIIDYVSSDTGILIEPASRANFVRDLRAAIELLIARPNMVERMGAAARERASTKFTFRAKIDTELEFIERILAN